MRFFLIGFMGSGKSYWGRQWAPQIGYDFYDLDDLIELQENKAVLDIFENKGEDYFRLKEAELLRSLAKHDNCIIACGGGTACFYDNIDWMNENGYTIYLSAPPSYLLEKIKNELEKRPLVKNFNEAEVLFFIEKKLKERLPFYERANKTIEVTNIDDKTWKKLSRVINK
jgi:shikimate kinase